MSKRFLDIFGVEHYHNLIKTEMITATQSGATNAWTGETDATGLAKGKHIVYTLPNGSAAGAATLNLTYPDGTTSGAKAVKTIDGDAVTTAWPTGSSVAMVYDGTAWRIIAGGTEPTKGELESFYTKEEIKGEWVDIAINSSQSLVNTSSKLKYSLSADGRATIVGNIDFILPAGSTIAAGNVLLAILPDEIKALGGTDGLGNHRDFGVFRTMQEQKEVNVRITTTNRLYLFWTETLEATNEYVVFEFAYHPSW